MLALGTKVGNIHNEFLTGVVIAPERDEKINVRWDDGRTFFHPQRFIFEISETKENEKVSLPSAFSLPSDTESRELRSALRGLYGAFKKGKEVLVAPAGFFEYVNSIKDSVHIRFQTIPKLEKETRKIFDEHGLRIPDWWRPVASGSRGGTSSQYAALGEVWFPVPEDPNILPVGFKISNGEARKSVLSFTIQMMLCGFPITDGPHKD